MIIRSKTVALGAALSAGLVALLATCARAPRMPALDGAVIEIRRSDQALRPGDPGYADTLQLFWFGTACHLIQLGGISVLTDPFVTNELDLFHMGSNPQRIRTTLARIAPPDCVLINHSHHDHILDAHAAMAQDSWRTRNVPLYGGKSAANLLAGFDGGAIDPRWHTIVHHQSVRIDPGDPGHGATVTAFRTDHGAHLKCGFTLANGLVSKPRQSPPRRLTDFQAGEVFNFLIELRSPSGARFNVFYLGAPFDLEKRPESLPPAGMRIDVAIILAPTADNVPGYPERHLAQLQPRHIVLSHFNSFAKEDPEAQLALGGIDFVKMPKLSRDVQSTFAGKASEYPQFEKLHIPAITIMGEGGEARNVIRIR